jgi:hypothetical protein
MPPSSLSPCDEPLCSPAVEPCVSCAGNEVRRRAAPSRAPDLQVASPGERGEVARASGMAVARARPRVLHAWPSASRAAQVASVTRLSSRAILAPSLPSPRRMFEYASGLRPERFLACGSFGRRASTRRRRRARPRLPGRCTARQARGRERERMLDRRTPAPLHGRTSSRQDAVPRCAPPPLSAEAFRQTLDRRGIKEGVRLWATAWALAQQARTRPTLPRHPVGSVWGGFLDFGRLDQMGRAHWATFDLVALSAHLRPTNRGMLTSC